MKDFIKSFYGRDLTATWMPAIVLPVLAAVFAANFLLGILATSAENGNFIRIGAAMLGGIWAISRIAKYWED